MLTTADGKPRGCGTVLFSSRGDAARAIGECAGLGEGEGVCVLCGCLVGECCFVLC